MIRTALASPWLPLLYWAAAVMATIFGARHESLKRRLQHHELQGCLSASEPTATPTPEHFSTSQLDPGKQASVAGYKPSLFWNPQISVLQRMDPSFHGLGMDVATNKMPVSPGARTSSSLPSTMLSIRVDSLERNAAKRLAIQCRTSEAIRNAHGRTVTIHGVVTQEVVSSTGKILIMAGSRVVGSGLVDPENGRCKSDGLWSIVFDDTELKVRAQLLDRPEGLPGMLGQEKPNQDQALQTEPERDGRPVFIPRNAPFVLELHGEILLRDVKSNEASNAEQTSKSGSEHQPIVTMIEFTRFKNET
jgi:hypothetical protein